MGDCDVAEQCTGSSGEVRSQQPVAMWQPTVQKCLVYGVLTSWPTLAMYSAVIPPSLHLSAVVS